jgi:hypothetical protein
MRNVSPSRSRKSSSAVAAPRKIRAAPLAVPMPRELLDATTTPDIVRVPARLVLAFDGTDPPGSAGFQKAIGALYGVAYTLRFARRDFKVAPLEGRWSEGWAWQLRMAVPGNVTEAEVAAAVRKKGADGVRLVRVPEQLAGRALHVGPYRDEERTFAQIHAAIAATGLQPARSHLEIYLGDPRRVAPARLKTVLLREVS